MMPQQDKAYHFVGIGGIGMSAIAEIMHKRGYKVSGSDLRVNAIVSRLSGLGIEISTFQDASLVDKADILVISSAIGSDNIEVRRANGCGKPVIKRAQMLSMLMNRYKGIAISGAHGKTTTTALISHILQVAGLDPTVVAGGIINDIKSNAKLGLGEYFVTEADESDGSFLCLPKKIAVVTNIDREHLDYYQSFNSLKDSFKQFITDIPSDGFSVVCADDRHISDLLNSIKNSTVKTYGFCPTADLVIENFQYKSSKNLMTCHYGGFRFADIELSVFGKHNVQNAAAALMVALEIGVGEEHIRHALATFNGVKRRFTCVGEFDGARIIDDYAHHPSEIRAVINTAREITNGRLISVIQPHRYSRLADLFDEFCDIATLSDYTVIIPLYSAGEKDTRNIDSKLIVDSVKKQGFNKIAYAESLSELSDIIYNIVNPDDLVLMMGAGNITEWAQDLEKCLLKSVKIASSFIA